MRGAREQLLLVSPQAQSLGAIQHGEDEVVGGVAACHEFIAELVVDEEQVVCVLPRIAEHLLRQRSNPPICELILLVGLHIAVETQEMREGERRELEHARSLTRVKEVHEVDAKVSLQPHHV